MSRKYSKNQLNQMDSDSAYWKVLEKPFGWRMAGFTFKSHAMYHTSKLESISLSSSQRDSIVRFLVSQGLEVDKDLVSLDPYERRVYY